MVVVVVVVMVSMGRALKKLNDCDGESDDGKESGNDKKLNYDTVFFVWFPSS